MHAHCTASNQSDILASGKPGAFFVPKFAIILFWNIEYFDVK